MVRIGLSSDEVVMNLVEMGFDKLDAIEAVKAVGKSCDDAIDFILKGHHRRTGGFEPASSSLCSTSNHKSCGDVVDSVLKEHQRNGGFAPASSALCSSRNSKSCDDSVDSILKMHHKTGGFAPASSLLCPTSSSKSCDDSVDNSLKGQHRTGGFAPASSLRSRRNSKSHGKRVVPSSISSGSMRQSSLLDHFKSMDKKQTTGDTVGSVVDSQLETLSDVSEETRKSFAPVLSKSRCLLETKLSDVCSEASPPWEKRVDSILRTRFGIWSLKNFQREALSTWVAHKDCLVLAATGSGKSLCFQIPALLTGKVIVLVSPLISLMHDQCLKLSRHKVSACFLGSGQLDNRIEQKAMQGMYQIIYVCPETVVRLITPLQRLARTHGIALFAIDEAHCVSKWGHDFRPHYRSLSVLRENFSASHLECLEYDVPIMALTATATTHVKEDILESLHMAKETKIVLTSFFRPNLCFSVKHTRTKCASSYAKDFQVLIDLYSGNRKTTNKKLGVISSVSEKQIDFNEEDAEKSLAKKNSSRGKEMSKEYLEDETDIFQNVDDWDVACGEFCAKSPCEILDMTIPFEKQIPEEAGHKYSPQQKDVEGPTIIYVPTRKETVNIAKYLSGVGLKAAAYNASLPKKHLRQVHQEFHENKLQVVVATIAFGMGIDKKNVRKIIHYGWPQSLEAYYQEAGRAGRDGELAECVLYADLTRTPTLLPSRRSKEQTKKAYKMLSDCFSYGMNTSQCRAKILVEYFGEDFSSKKCNLCDVCTDGTPEQVNVREEAKLLIQVISAFHTHVENSSEHASYEDYGLGNSKQKELSHKPTLLFFISKIREHSHKFMETDLLWWKGLARILEAEGYIKQMDNKARRVEITFIEPTEKGKKQLDFQDDKPLYVYPEADMLVSIKQERTYSGFSDWGKGWADPEIRRQRLETMKRPREREPSRRQRPHRKFQKKAPWRSKE